MKAAIIGSREYYFEIDKYIAEVEEYLHEKITMIITGGARGVDTAAADYADKRGIPKMIFLPDYKEHNKSAPLIRNKEIVRSADVVIAFWDGKSRGTLNALGWARAFGKKALIFKLGKR